MELFFFERSSNLVTGTIHLFTRTHRDVMTKTLSTSQTFQENRNFYQLFTEELHFTYRKLGRLLKATTKYTFGAFSHDACPIPKRVAFRTSLNTEVLRYEDLCNSEHVI